jgi:alanine dehydrogenase
MLVLTRSEVEELLDVDALFDALGRAHAELSAGKASMPPRIAAWADSGLLSAMPAYLPSAGLGCKLVTVFPGNTDRTSHQAAIMLFDPANGTPVALMDGTYVTETRTAVAAALAASLLARDDAKVLAIIGTGVQARSHARAFAGIRDWDEIRVAGRDAEKTQELAAEIGATAAASFEDAARGADVVAATTHSAEPVVRLEWLSPGAHVSSVGSPQTGGEVDPAIVREATIVVETRAALEPPPAGASELQGLGADDIYAELGELDGLAGAGGGRPGRTSPAEITLYKSVGVAVQDLAAAALVLTAAHERGVGREIELEEIHR